MLHTHNHLVHHYGVLAGRIAGVPAIVNTRHGAPVEIKDENSRLVSTTGSALTLKRPGFAPASFADRRRRPDFRSDLPVFHPASRLSRAQDTRHSQRSAFSNGFAPVPPRRAPRASSSASARPLGWSLDEDHFTLICCLRRSGERLAAC